MSCMTRECDFFAVQNVVGFLRWEGDLQHLARKRMSSVAVVCTVIENR